MCDLFDDWWKLLIGMAFALSVLFLLLRVYGKGTQAPLVQRYRLAAMGAVALIMLALFGFGLLCAGSPGDYPGVVPD